MMARLLAPRAETRQTSSWWIGAGREVLRGHWQVGRDADERIVQHWLDAHPVERVMVTTNKDDDGDSTVYRQGLTR